MFGRGRTTGMILWTCLTAAKELPSYLTREDKSFTPLVFRTTQLIQYVPIHNKNSVFLWQSLKICTSSMQTCLEPNCNIRHKWLQPGEWNFRRLSGYELAGNEIFLRHGSSGDWGSSSAAWVEWTAIKEMLYITWEAFWAALCLAHVNFYSFTFYIYLIY